MHKLYPYTIQLLITVIIVLAGMLLLKKQFPARIVKVDLIAINSHYTELMLTNQNTAQNISERVKANLEPLLASYASSRHVVILQAQAVVDPTTPDITKEIMDELDQKIGK